MALFSREQKETLLLRDNRVCSLPWGTYQVTPLQSSTVFIYIHTYIKARVLDQPMFSSQPSSQPSPTVVSPSVVPTKPLLAFLSHDIYISHSYFAPNVLSHHTEQLKCIQPNMISGSWTLPAQFKTLQATCSMLELVYKSSDKNNIVFLTVQQSVLQAQVSPEWHFHQYYLKQRLEFEFIRVIW